MDVPRIPPLDLRALLAERAERMEKFREDRDRPRPSKRDPKPSHRNHDEESDEDSGQRGAIISVDA